MELPPNTLCKVKSDAPYNADRIGRLEFYGRGRSGGVAVLSSPRHTRHLFAVAAHDIEPVQPGSLLNRSEE